MNYTDIRELKQHIPSTHEGLFNVLKQAAAKDNVDLLFKTANNIETSIAAALVFGKSNNVSLFIRNISDAGPLSTDIVVAAIMGFLKEGGNLTIIFDESEWREKIEFSNRVLRLFGPIFIDNNYDKGQLVIYRAYAKAVGTVTPEFTDDKITYFIAGDTNAALCLFDEENGIGICNFNDKKWTDKFLSVFNTLKENSKLGYVTSPN